MEEFEPKLKNKIINKVFIGKYIYLFVLAVLLVGGISYGYTFFVQNKKIASGSITTANLTINFSDRNISTNLVVPTTDTEGIEEYSKSLTISNVTSIDGRVKLTLERTSGLLLSDMRYALIINGAIQKIDNIPTDGVILSSAIMGNDTMNVELRLWPKTNYNGSETTFVGEIIPEIKYLGPTATSVSDLSGKYVNFNCNGNSCEVWRIVKIEDNRLVLTKQADYSGATSRTNSNKYNPNSFSPVISFNDDSLITSLSTDGKNVYLAETVKISGGSGTQADPYILINNDFREEDKKVVAVITYKDGTDTLGTQNVYYNETNYVSQEMDDSGFRGWTDNTNNYDFGSTITINSDVDLTAIIVETLQRKINILCNDSNVAYVKKYNATQNGAAIDTPTGSGNEDVCYYTTTSSSRNSDAEQNGNVIFGDYCWQIVRTTSDGGVKLIYNGKKTNDDKCPNNGSQRPSEPGIIGTSGATKNVTGAKLYGKAFTYSGTTFTLTDTFTANWNGDVDGDSKLDYPKIIGTFSCLDNNSSCDTIYYVGSYISEQTAGVVTYTIGSPASYSQIGNSPFSAYHDSLALSGYMFNEYYNSLSKEVAIHEDLLTRAQTSASASYIFADTAEWNGTTYVLSNDNGDPLTASTWESIRNTNEAHGLYTCRSNSASSCNPVFYVEGKHTENYMYYLPITGGENVNNKTIVIGTGYEENNGVYSLTGTTTIYLKDWYNNYSNSNYKNVYICDNLNSSTCTNARYYVSDTNNYRIFTSRESNNYIYGNSVSYENGEYIINTDSDPTKYQQIWKWNAPNTNITNSHYTCFKTNTNNCGSSVYFVYFTNGNTAYYIELKNDERINDALQKMININNYDNTGINKYDSAIKALIDNWYNANLSSLGSYLDNNAVFCNDRSINALNGWGPTGTTTTTSSYLRFRYTNSSNATNASLSCNNKTDRFSKNNSDAELKYSIGLLTESERAMMHTGYARTDQTWWLSSPVAYNDYVQVGRYVDATGGNNAYNVRISLGVRPVIVIKPRAEITGGNGSYNTPYIIDTTSS